jgi:hypothetical protein
MLPVQQEGLFSTLAYQTGQEGTNDEPLSRLSPRFRLFIALQRPSWVGIRPVKYLSELLSPDGYQTGQDEHRIYVPVSWLPQRKSSFIALQRPSSVGIRPVEYSIERVSAYGLLVKLAKMSTKLTYR